MKTILILDDEKNIHILYKKEFTEEGYNVIATENPEEAVSLCSEGIDLVILDIKLSEKDGGLEVLRRIKEKRNTIPVIINSAYPHYQYDFSSWLADAYVVKSGNLTELKEKVKEFIGRGE